MGKRKYNGQKHPGEEEVPKSICYPFLVYSLNFKTFPKRRLYTLIVRIWNTAVATTPESPHSRRDFGGTTCG